jgi:hypothetical protein
MRLELSPSPRLAALIVALHAAAALSCLAAVPGAGGGLLACALTLLGLAAAWSRALLKSAASVRAIELEGPGIAINLASGARIVAEVAERRYVTRFMVALPVLRPVRRTILVTRDMLGADSFRALRIWALWGKLPVKGRA